MKTWHAVINPRVEHRLFDILSYVNDEPLFNPDAALSILENFEAIVKMVERMGDRIPIGTHPVMRERQLRRINFREHRYYLIFRIKNDIVQIVDIAHFLEDPDKVLR